MIPVLLRLYRIVNERYLRLYSRGGSAIPGFLSWMPWMKLTRKLAHVASLLRMSLA